LLFASHVEVLFKRHFWIVHLLFMLAVAWLVMRTANAFVEISLLPLPTGRAGPAPIAKVTPVAALNLDRVARALGLPVPKPEPVVTEPTIPKVDLNAAPVKTTLRVKLLGTLVSENMPEWSVASIQDTVTLKTGTYMIGDRVQGEAERDRRGRDLDVRRARAGPPGRRRRAAAPRSARAAAAPWWRK
jgi:general secretion pathway protein C